MTDFNKTIQTYVCNTVTFSSYADLTSRDGKSYLKRQNKETEFTHYMICKTPRLVFISANPLQGGQIEIKFCRALQFFQTEAMEIIIEPLLGESSIVSVRGEYPEIFVTLVDGRDVCFASLFEFFCNDLTRFKADIGDLFDIEVVYIGQTEITEKYIRLDGHETYCKAAEETLKKKPECELFIKVLHFTPSNICIAENMGLSVQDKMNKLKYIRNIPRKHWVTLIEGALIYDLKPLYNTHYKNKFPSREHSAYSLFFDGQIDDVCILLDEEFRLYSTIHPNGNRTKTIDLSVCLR